MASCFQKEILFMASYNQVPLRMLPYGINELGVSHPKAVWNDNEKILKCVATINGIF